MDFIVRLPCTQFGYDSIWVTVDRLTKVAHFILVKTTYTDAKLAELYMARIVYCMVFRRELYLIEVRSSPLSSRRNCVGHCTLG
jgi:hypothetical protein